MGDEVIVPSWEDAANRWMDAYGEQRERAEAAEARCAALEAALRPLTSRSIWAAKWVAEPVPVKRARALLESPTEEQG
jgi:hypothetical protein